MLDITPANTTIGVSRRRGADSTSLRSEAAIRPECSATPMPISATSTVPSGAKPVKLVTRLVRMRCRPSRLSRFTALTVLPVVGCCTSRPASEASHDAKMTSSASSANSVAGWGRALPPRSMASRMRSRRVLVVLSVVFMIRSLTGVVA